MKDPGQETYHYRIEVVGESIKWFIDGELTFDVEDEDLSWGT